MLFFCHHHTVITVVTLVLALGEQVGFGCGGGLEQNRLVYPVSEGIVRSCMSTFLLAPTAP